MQKEKEKISKCYTIDLGLSHNHYESKSSSSCCTANLAQSCSDKCSHGFFDKDYRTIMSYSKAYHCAPGAGSSPPRIPIYSGYDWEKKFVGKTNKPFCANNKIAFNTGFVKASEYRISSGWCDEPTCNKNGCTCPGEPLLPEGPVISGRILGHEVEFTGTIAAHVFGTMQELQYSTDQGKTWYKGTSSFVGAPMRFLKLDGAFYSVIYTLSGVQVNGRSNIFTFGEAPPTTKTTKKTTTTTTTRKPTTKKTTKKTTTTRKPTTKKTTTTTTTEKPTPPPPPPQTSLSVSAGRVISRLIELKFENFGDAAKIELTRIDYQNRKKVRTFWANDHYYDTAAIHAGKSYSYSIRTVSASGSLSQPSKSITVTALGQEDRFKAQVVRIVQGALMREPNKIEFENFLQRLKNREALASIAEELVKSSEFTSTHGKLSNKLFVKTMWEFNKGRITEKKLAAETQKLNDGSATRGKLLSSYTETRPSFIQKLEVVMKWLKMALK
jgi:hypothetical protein